MVISTWHTSQRFSVTKTWFGFWRHTPSSTVPPESHESLVFLFLRAGMTSIHLASACGYVRSLAWVRIWGKFLQVSVKRSAVHICYRLRLVFLARFCLTLEVNIYSQERD